MVWADGPDFCHRPQLAGKASLTVPGFVVRRGLGVANFAPELRLPVELVYDSSSESSGLFGHAWRCPQLESSVRWDKDGLLWTTPWGEQLKFFPKKTGKAAKNAVMIPSVEVAKRGHGLFAPYSDWEADAGVTDYAKAREFTLSGKDGLKGWRFVYADGRLRSVETPQGVNAEFEYTRSGELVAVSSRGTRFVELAHGGDGLVSSLALNGVPVALAYAKTAVTILPKTVDGQPVRKTVPVLASLRTAALAPETFTYAKGYLASAARGGRVETFAVQTETPDERRRNLLSEDRKSGVVHTGKVAGRLLADADFRYAYPAKTAVELKNALGETARHDYDVKTGTYRVQDFSGRSRTTYYFMRYDAAYLGKVRKVVDGRGRDLVDFRYDKTTGKPVRVTDRLGNKRVLEYDTKGNCVKLSRRADWSLSEEPVRSFVYDRQDRLVGVSELDADGNAVRTTKLAYDKSGRPTRIADGRRTVTIDYGANGFPASLKDDFSTVSLAYDRFNRLVSATDPYGVVTTRAYADHGGVAKIERRYGSVLLSSIAVAYDACGRPVSVTDQDGRTTACDRDELGRIVKERYANGTEVAYDYDRLGRLAKVVDENGHEIAFGWDGFGLSSRLTAAGQLAEAKRDKNGLVASVAASVTGRVERVVRREYDAFDRVTKIDYGNGETETFAYDKWGRLAERTRGKRTESYSYDHFGRLVRRNENGTVFTFAYDAWGRRTRRTEFRLGGGETTEERRAYDKYGRLTEIASFGASVKYFYDAKGRVARQVVDGTPIDFTYTKYGQLAGKYLGGREKPEASVEYEYSKSGQIVARTANGVRQTYEYDGRGQLLAVKEDGADVERYVYDKAGNMLRKTIRLGRAHTPGAPQYRTTTFTFDGANQLVSSTTDGVTTSYAYDAAGRLVKEGDRTYRYGYLDKVISVSEGDRTYTYDYHVDGQLARAVYGNGTGDDGRAVSTKPPPPASSEDFLWDGLALIKRGDERFLNEPHVGGGNPVASSKGTTYFNDILGTTVGAKRNRKYSAAALTAFGERLTDAKDDSPAMRSPGEGWFTGKPHVDGLGHAFLFRNYRAGLAKWQTSDPMGYPDGWNQLAYCGNGVADAVDLWGCMTLYVDQRRGALSHETSWRGTVFYRLKGFDDVFDNFCVDLDYEVIGSFDGSIDIVFSNIRGSWDIKHAFESESMNGMSCSYSFTYGVASTTVTYQAEELPLLSCVTWSNNRFNYVEKTIKWNIYEYFDASLAIVLGPFGISTPISGNLYKVLDSWLDITVIYKEAKE